MKTIECDRCHRLFRSTDERIFIHTKTQDFNWCTECTRRALELMDTRLDEESKIRLNHECMIYRLKIPIWNKPAGLTFYRKANSYANTICDLCGRRIGCDWYECTNIREITGIDCCRICSKEHLEELDD